MPFTGKLAALSDHAPSLSITEALGQNGPCGVVYADLRAQTVRVTAEAAEILGWGAQGFSEAPYERLPAALRQLIDASAGAPPAQAEFQLTAGARGPRTLHASLVPANESAVIVLLCDATAHRQFLEHLEQVDRLVSVGTLASSMAHEIKNALVAGKTVAELLLEKHPGLELAELVRREINRIDAIVARMLKLARAPQPTFSAVSIHSVLEQSRSLVEPKLRSPHVEFEPVFNANPDLVNGDVDQLLQVFVNLLLNAVEAMGNGGKISVTTQLVPGSRAGERFLSIRVQDTGSGISEESRRRLFKPFFTTKPGGTGLGLAITQKIIQRHQGTIAAETTAGAGAAFVVLLPSLAAP